MKQRSNTPRIVLCAGLYRSGSTWLYNATLMLMKSCTKAVGIYSDILPEDFAKLLKDDACVVIKCHAPDPNLIAVARLACAPLILSVRDPRDCLVSLESAFQFPKNQSLVQLKKSGSALVRIADYPRRQLVKYEQAQDQVETLKQIACLLGVSVNDEIIERIAKELSIEAIKTRISNWEAEGVLDKSRPTEVWTDESHWHANHCGDGLSRKYIDRLSPREAIVIENSMRDFFTEFNYTSEVPPPVESNQTLHFNGDGVIYATEGFSVLEEWGVWTEQHRAKITIPLANYIDRFRLEMSLVRPSSFNRATAELFINGRKLGGLFQGDSPSELLLLYEGELNGNWIDLEFRFENLTSPQSLGINSDDRLIGVGVKSLRVSHL